MSAVHQCLPDFYALSLTPSTSRGRRVNSGSKVFDTKPTFVVVGNCSQIVRIRNSILTCRAWGQCDYFRPAAAVVTVRMKPVSKIGPRALLSSLVVSQKSEKIAPAAVTAIGRSQCLSRKRKIRHKATILIRARGATQHQRTSVMFGNIFR
jgi:hypothetical protein